METLRINENIRLNLIPMTKLKTTSVGVYIHRPLNAKDASFNALLPMVLKCATKEFGSREIIAGYLDNLYGATMGATVIKLGEDQAIYFDAETISDKFAPNGEKLLIGVLRLMMSVIFEPKVIDNAFDEKIVEREKKNAIDRIDAFVNDKRNYAMSRCLSETARGTDFAIMRLGDKKTLSEITAKDLYDYYKSVITSSVIDIYVCGEADINELFDVVSGYVKDFEFSDAKINKTEILRRDVEKINDVTERMDVNQGKLSMGFITNVEPSGKQSYALSVFNSVFGAGAHSKLFNNVREKLSLAYYASSSIEKFKGILIVNAGIEFENFQKTYDEVLVQLDEIKKGNITDHEFQSSINTILNACKSYYDDQRALVSFHLTNDILGVERTLDEYMENIKKVTVEDVVEVANKLQLDTVYFLAGKEEA